MAGPGRSPNSIAPPAPAEGQVIAGKYRVESLIGEGGMGTVLSAHHQLLDVRVAVKLLSPQLMRHGAVVERFMREARAVARLQSEHVVRVMDVGTIEGGQPYIVMELLVGEDLNHRVEREGALAITYAADCLLQAAEAMAHAHAAGIVHRDLKPANLFASTLPDGREVIKVLDFGIAKLSDAATGRDLAKSGALTGEHAIGSPSYMAPEQVRNSRSVDHRADIWALGTILYELLTGSAAFDGGGLGEIFANVLQGEPQALRQLRPDVPAALEAAVARCLARDPAERFASVAELARAVAPFGSGAWAGLVERIDETLARAGGAPGSSPSLQNSASYRRAAPTPMAAFEPQPQPATNSLSRSGRQIMVASAETMAMPAETPSPRGRRVLLLAGAAVAAALVAAGVLATARGAARARLDTPAPSLSSSAGVVAPPPATSTPLSWAMGVVAPPPATSTPATAASPARVMPPASSSGIAAVPAPTPGQHRKPSPSRPPPAPPRPGLPGVLTSPE